MYLSVRVSAGAKKEQFVANEDGSYTIAVREPAKQNLANRRVLALIASHLGVSEKSLRIISGHHSPKKIISTER